MALAVRGMAAGGGDVDMANLGGPAATIAAGWSIEGEVIAVMVQTSVSPSTDDARQNVSLAGMLSSIAWP